MEEAPEAFIFDLDGTIYLGNEPIPGAEEVLMKVRERGSEVRFVTNNPRHSRDAYIQKLAKMNIQASLEEIVTSGWLTAEYLGNNPSYGKVFLVGENQLRTELLNSGVVLTEEGISDTVLVSFDTTLTYEKLQHAYYCLINGANFIATNPDFVCPTAEGGLIDSGSIIAALEVATKKNVEKIIGKPSPLLGELILNDLKLPPDNCVVVGDRLNTDVSFGQQAGMKTIWIKNSRDKSAKNMGYNPDFIVETISDIFKEVFR